MGVTVPTDAAVVPDGLVAVVKRDCPTCELVEPVLRELLARSVPRALFERPKAGFGIPVGQWLSGPLRPWAEDLLSADALRKDGLLDVRRVRRLWSRHVSGREDAGYELWPIIMFQAWRGAQR